MWYTTVFISSQMTQVQTEIGESAIVPSSTQPNYHTSPITPPPSPPPIPQKMCLNFLAIPAFSSAFSLDFTNRAFKCTIPCPSIENQSVMAPDHAAVKLLLHCTYTTVVHYCTYIKSQICVQLDSLFPWQVPCRFHMWRLHSCCHRNKTTQTEF